MDGQKRGRPPGRLPDEEGLDDEGPRLPDPHRHRRQLPLRPGRAVQEEARGEARAEGRGRDKDSVDEVMRRMAGGREILCRKMAGK